MLPFRLSIYEWPWGTPDPSKGHNPEAKVGTLHLDCPTEADWWREWMAERLDYGEFHREETYNFPMVEKNTVIPAYNGLPRKHKRIELLVPECLVEKVEARLKLISELPPGVPPPAP